MQCDCCGVIETEYGDYAAWSDPTDARMNADGWMCDEEDLCPACWCWPEDLPDYPGDDLWQGSDDPVRKPGCHERRGCEAC